MAKVKIAFIGCGGIAEVHLNHLLGFEDVEIVGFFSQHIEKAKRFAEKSGQGRCYADFIEMFDRERPDAIYICTIPSAHGAFEIEAIRRGIHFFIEKPIALSSETADLIENEALKAGIITCVGYQERYLDIIGRLKAYLTSRKTGLIQGAWIGGIPGAAWWRQKKLSGGQIVEQSTHIFDMLRYLIGEPEGVFCKGGVGIVGNVPGYDIEDYSSSMIVFKNGAIATVYTGCYVNDKLETQNGIKFVLSDSLVEYRLRKSIIFSSVGNSKEYFVGNDGFSTINRAFIDAIQRGDKALIRSDYSDGVKTLKLTLACNESMAVGRSVQI